MKTLTRYMKKREIETDDQKIVGNAFKSYGLRQARIMTARIMNGEKMQSIPRKKTDPWDDIGD